MKTNRIFKNSKQIIWVAIVIAVLAASMLPLTGYATSPYSGQAGYGQSTILKIDNSEASSKGLDGSAFHSKVSVSAVNTGGQQTFSVIKPAKLAFSDLILDVVTAEEVVVEEVVVEEIVVEEVVSTTSASNTPTFVSLANFAQQVTNGNSGQITGLYSDNLFALNVTQQPSGNAGYVSTAGNSTTQFGMASGLGFLAHNYLSGSLFFYLYGGAPITVVYGDGHTQAYQVSQIRKFQALSPESPYSDFVDLASGSTLSASDLFYATYGVGGQMVLQTCISANGNSSWGRLFVIATPAS